MTFLAIVLKDLARSLRSPFVLAFLLVLPLLQAGLPYLAFRGLSQGFDVQRTRVLLVNLDRPAAEYPGFLAGEMLASMFREQGLRGLLDVKEEPSEAAARAAVDAGRTDVVLIIPPGFTAALFRNDARAEIVIYHDPALTLGPAIVRDVVTNFTDGFAGSLLAADVAAERAAAEGRPLDEPARLAVMRGYGDWANALGESLKEGVHPAIRYDALSKAQDSESVMQALIGPILLGMLVFFAFFIGAIAALSFLREREQGTLARLFRTPASKTAVIAGKFAAVVLLLALQTALLLGIGNLIFGIAWGAPLPVFFNGLGLVVSAGGFGILLIAFMRSTRQAFILMGGAVILTGMAGGTMTTSFANLPALFSTVNLLTPQGWIIRGFTAAMRGGGPAETLVPAIVAAGIGLLCTLIGFWKINSRPV
jgi:ABC-2 type transport system permease protein